MWTKDFRDYIRNYMYMADLAHIAFNISAVDFGWKIKVRGYSDTLQGFIDWLLKELEKFNNYEDKQRWDNLHFDGNKNLNNWFIGTPFRMLPDYVSDTLQERHWSVSKVRECFKNMDYDSYLLFKKNWMKTCRLNILLEGNCTLETGTKIAEQIVDSFEKTYNPTWLTKLQSSNEKRVVKLEDKEHHIIEYQLTLEEDNN